MPPAGGPGGGTIPSECGGREESVCPFCPPLPVPLTRPSLPLFPLTGQETKEISWEQVGRRAGCCMNNLCTLHGLSLSPRPTLCQNILSPCPGGEGCSLELSCGLVPSGLVGDKMEPSVSTSSLVHGSFHGCGLFGSWELCDCWTRREPPGSDGFVLGLGKSQRLKCQLCWLQWL